MSMYLRPENSAGWVKCPNCDQYYDPNSFVGHYCVNSIESSPDYDYCSDCNTYYLKDQQHLCISTDSILLKKLNRLEAKLDRILTILDK